MATPISTPAGNGAATPEQPQAQPAAPARQTPAQQLAAAYDVDESLGDFDDFDDSASATPPAPNGQASARSESAQTPPSTTRPVPPKNPVDGRFLSPNDPRANDQRPAHPSWLVNQALDLGMPDDEIANTATDVLGQAVALAHRNLSRDVRPQRRLEVVDEALNQGRDPFAPPPAAGPGDPIDFGKDADGNPITEEQYDPAFRSVFKTIRQQDQEIKQLKALVQQLASREANRDQLSLMDQIDAQIATFNDPRLGNGSARGLDTKGPEYRKRRAIWQEAIQLAGPNADNGKALAQLRQAYENLFGDGQSQPPRQQQRRQGGPAPAGRQRRDQRFEEFEPDDAVDPRLEWDQGGSMPPTHRGGGRPERRRGPQAAREAVARKMREMSQGEDAEDDIGQDDFIG